MILVDTSVWIEVLRARNPFDLESVAPFEDVVICLPVLQEVLQGIRDERAFRLAREAMNAIPALEAPLSQAVVLEAIDLYRAARRQGITIRSSVDCIIAAIAVRHDALVLHRDRDYAALARFAPLRQRAL